MKMLSRLLGVRIVNGGANTRIVYKDSVHYLKIHRQDIGIVQTEKGKKFEILEQSTPKSDKSDSFLGSYRIRDFIESDKSDKFLVI